MTPLRSLHRDFADLLRCLNREGVEYLLVGAYALAFHGVPRATGDMDVFVRPTPENANRIWHALCGFGAPLSSVGVEERDFTVPGMVYQIGMPPRRIDILTEISGLDFDEAWESREPADFEDSTVHFIGRQALILNKRATGRLKDLADVERLEATSD